MAESKRITKKDNPFRWRWRSLKNWCYNKWMRHKGYVPTTFSPYDNIYQYELKTYLDKELAKETEPEYELVGFKKQYALRNWADTDITHKQREVQFGRQRALTALRNGDIDNGCIIRRSLPRKERLGASVP